MQKRLEGADLDWVTHDLIQGHQQGALQEIQRLAGSLTRIRALLPAEFDEPTDVRRRCYATQRLRAFDTRSGRGTAALLEGPCVKSRRWSCS